ncbi:MAG: lamin tail domain-containing protein [Deltaproteobacteria bacterium]|jgi:hypothetical protein|nr:lamin tail domain-containing protein [Deltaproteobacteria bacterium]
MKITFAPSLLLLFACEPTFEFTPAEPTGAYDGLVINEVAAAGRPHDWFELYNRSDRPISLDGLSYSDHPQDPRRRAQLGPGVLAPGAHLLIELPSGGFRLGAGEVLAVFGPDGTRIDVLDWSEGDAPVGRSYARQRDGSEELVSRATPTPGAPNGVSP